MTKLWGLQNCTLNVNAELDRRDTLKKIKLQSEFICKFTARWIDFYG